MVPQIVKIYNKSDFTIQVPLADGYDNQEFRFTIYTCGEIENGWVASFINGNYTNCSVTEDIVTIFVDNNNNINPGCVTVQAEYDYSNHHFLDDEDNVKDNFKTNIYLVNYETNAFSAMYRPSVLPDLSETTDFVTWPEIEEELAYYVTFTYLNTYNYITEEYLDNTLDNYITEEQLGEYGFLTYSDLDNMSYATESYVTSKLAGKQDMLINGINIKSVNGYSLVGSGNVEITFPEVDLSGYVTYSSLQTYLGSYVTKYDLSQAGYLTSNDISSFITSDDVYDILAESSYITSRTLSDMGYVTNQVLEQTLSDASYLTQDDISNMSYVTQSELNNASYATTSYVENYVATYGGNVDLSAYVSKDELNQAGYITMGDVSACGYLTYIPSEYITESELDGMSYATTTYVEQYVTTYAPTPDLSAYVTKTELNQAGYLTSIPSDYATYDAISQMGYITSIPSEYITESELDSMSYITQTELESLLEQASYATTTYVENYVNTHSGPIDLSAYVTKDELNQAGYISSIPSEYITESELDSMSYLTQNDISNMSYATTTYVENYVNTHSGPIDLSAYVTKDELNQAGYLTSIPSDYATYDAISQMGYITSIPSEYITESELSGMSYVTQSELNNASYATTSYVEQYVTTYGGSNIQEVTQAEYDAMEQAGTLDPDTIYIITDAPGVDMSYYVTYSYMIDYINTYAPTQDLSAYVTYTSLQSYLGSYVTKDELSNASYATTTYVADYVSQHTTSQVQSDWNETNSTYMSYILNKPDLDEFAKMSKVTQAEYDAMEQAGTLDPDTIYVITDAPAIDLSYYATYSYLEAYYATQSYVSEYVNTYAPTPDLSAYVTKTELNNAGYITSIPSDYATYDAISAMGYITSIPSEYVTESELNSMSYATQTYVADYVSQHTPTPDLSAYVTKTELNNAGYITMGDVSACGYITSIPSEYITETELSSMGYITSSSLPDMSSYITKTELDSMSYITQTQLSSNSYINEQYLDNVGYTTAYVLTQNQYDGLSQSDKEKETIYIISDQNTYMNNELVTESSLDSRGFLTAANFQYDSATGTLTLNI